MHLGRMFSKKGKEKERGWLRALMRRKEELIWDQRGAESGRGTRSTARLLIFPNSLADGERREVVSAADADGDAGDDRRRAYGGPRVRQLPVPAPRTRQMDERPTAD